ncbi:type VI secretion protein VgrG [Burkholderia cepacia]|uniref:type VI secretion system Vgr family protein n=6 Tax=Burkholderia cepacia TaxID=292 RepID=UPI00075CFE06|nr:type VI secretion system tip protein TssI/VgrG [Burkholderia cepacia]KVA58344.1 type VI secretion protein VgrG [Burkholderia cepacia]KVA70775.1 type VI secretion protein VgrG [Burkholderia cepacia]KVA80836.1 type VI secretion protein VgrG [Burkholderia cepacia]KVA82311.1 type VI secretion protein VgrG [Burkholderia cepacia]KVA92925.1 type VI secretion protein VgrG [Burkholderia cepacia]
MTIQSDLRFTFTAGDESFEVVEFTLHEGLSETFLLQVELASANAAIDFGQVLDCNGLLTIWQGGVPVRYVHGAVSSFVQGDTGFRRTRYVAVVEPRLARLKLSSDWRIFQTLSVPEIATVVLKAHHQTLDYEQRVTNEHLAREYCVQAGDTDYDFVERILREEGFFYAFQHKVDGHRLIHCDRLFIFGRQQGEPVLYHPTPGGDQSDPCLRTFAYTENVRTARQVQRDYTFTSPRHPHEYPREGTDLDHQGRGYARYDYPGRYKHEASGKAFTQDRLRGHRRDARMARVSGDDARLQPGIAFDLTGHPREDMNRGWRPVSIVHHGVQYTSQAEEGADAQQGTHYRYEAVLVPDDAEWRAEPLPRPRIDGPQPATVVGPEGEEIYTDAYGRVKVQFPWDREGKYDEHSSCWIQVAQNWAGATWGHMAIPRIGQEVIVVNLDGDPDQPLIIGRAYNRLQLPPYELPRHKTRMTIKSQTHKGAGYNELRFEDEKDQEEIYVHAQKDQNIHVNHDETTFVGNDRSEQVEHDETIAIGNDRKETVGRDEQVTIGQDRRHDIGQDDFLSIGRNHTIHTGKDRSEEVGNHRRDRTAANHTVDIGGHLEQRVQGRAELEAGQAIRHRTKVVELHADEVIRLRGPGGTITLDDGGITLDAVVIRFKGPLTADSVGRGNRLGIDGNPLPGEPTDPTDLPLSE